MNYESENRLQLTDTGMDVIVKMSEGNPGALNVLMLMLNEGKRIDPQGALGGLGAILMLDTLGIYGSRIWMLFKDFCKQDIIDVFAVIRAWQLGGLAGASREALHHAIDNYGQGVDLEAVREAVKTRLPSFNF